MTPPLLAAPLAVQAASMLVDELHFHRRRGLPRWERIGHPLDTLTVLACYAVALAFPPDAGHLRLFVGFAIFSCLFVTKDELVHAKLCPPGEHWLHAILFVLHPVVLAVTALLWIDGSGGLVALQAGATLAFGLYQLAYWAWRGPVPESVARENSREDTKGEARRGRTIMIPPRDLRRGRASSETTRVEGENPK
jgi:hypothetical protein